MFESSTGGTGSILTFIDSITRDENGNVSLVNDEAEPSPNYYYGTNDDGVRGWYLLTDEVGLTCVTLPSCQTIIDIEAAIDDLQEEILLKANTADISAVGFSNDYNDLDNKPTIPDVSGFVPYTGATQDVDLGVNNIYTNKVYLLDEANDNHGSIHYSDGDFHIEDADGHKLLVIEDGFMQLHLTDTIQSNLFTSDLTATRDHYLPNQSGTIALTSDIPAAQVNSDWNATSGVAQILNKPTIPSIAGLVPETRTLTINGTTQDLSANRTFTIATGLTVGTTPITSGTVGRVLFEGTGNVLQESANLTWNNSTNVFGITGQIQVSTDVRLGATGILYWAGRAWIESTSSGNIRLTDSTNSSFDRLQFGGSTTAFPALKRSGAALCVVDASGTSLSNFLIGTTTDAGYKLDVNGTARVTGAGSTGTTFGLTVRNSSGTLGLTVRDDGTVYNRFMNTTQLSQDGAGNAGYIQGNFCIGAVAYAGASAVLDLRSTTRGFLPPRMTTTQKNAISSPAAGLVVYDTTLNKLCVYTTTWETITSV
jgi:hypothetical protein